MVSWVRHFFFRWEHSQNVRRIVAIPYYARHTHNARTANKKLLKYKTDKRANSSGIFAKGLSQILMCISHTIKKTLNTLKKRKWLRRKKKRRTDREIYLGTIYKNIKEYYTHLKYMVKTRPKKKPSIPEHLSQIYLLQRESWWNFTVETSSQIERLI